MVDLCIYVVIKLTVVILHRFVLSILVFGEYVMIYIEWYVGNSVKRVEEVWLSAN